MSALPDTTLDEPRRYNVPTAWLDRYCRMRVALARLERWDALALDGSGARVLLAEVAWARALIDDALRGTSP